MQSPPEQGLHQKRDQFRIRIRREKHDEILKQHRKQIIANQPPDSFDALGSESNLAALYRQSKRSLTHAEHSYFLNQLEQERPENPLYVRRIALGIVGNLLVDDVELDTVERIAELVMASTDLQLKDEVYTEVQAFAISGVFRKYNCLEESLQNRLDEVLLSTIFEVLSRYDTPGPSRSVVHKDLLDALHSLFNCDHLELYCRLQRNQPVMVKLIDYHQALQKQPHFPCKIDLEVMAFKLYRQVAKSNMRIDQIFGKASTQLAQIFLNALVGYDEMNHDKQLGKEALQTLEELLGCRHCQLLFQHPQFLNRVLEVWHPQFPGILFKLTTNYPALLDLSMETAGSVLSDLTDGCQYISDRNTQLKFLEALFEFLKLHDSRHGSSSPTMIRFQSIGGYNMLNELEGKPQPERTQALLKDILDYLYNQDEMDFENRDKLLPE